MSPVLRNLLSGIWTFPRRVLVLLIELYQRTLSPDHGPLKDLHPYGYCRHSPTCSQYAKEVIAKRGAVLGATLATWRVLSCNPCGKVTARSNAPY